jgi:protein-tyrosine kinase
MGGVDGGASARGMNEQMNIVEEATRRLEQLTRAGVKVPWAAAGLESRDMQARAETGAPVATPAGPGATVHRLTGEELAEAALARKQPRRSTAGAARSAITVTLDLHGLELSGHLVPSQRRTPLAEEFRHVKRPLLTVARDNAQELRRQTLIMVTSALSGEGKTFCAINLAMSMAAEIDRSVLLIDADVVQPNLLRRLGVPAMPGLLDLLTDPTLELSQVVAATNVPKLSILSAGTPNAMSTELLASEAMERLLASMAEDPDRVVIFDAPPLLLTSEAQVLASRVGQVVMVVEAGRTPRQALAQAFAQLEACPVVMPLLNKAQHSALPLGYGYVREAEQGPLMREA